MNVECDQPTLDELESAFRFNDAVLRNLILIRDAAVTEPSPLAKSEEEPSSDDSGGERRRRDRPERVERIEEMDDEDELE